MVHCRGCGKEIHESAKVCPSCGAAQAVTKRTGKSKIVAGLLALFLGAFGIHRFYLRQWWGIFYLLFVWTGIPSIISLVETFVFLLSNQENWDNKYNDGVNSGDSPRLTIVLVVVIVIFCGFFVIGILAAIAIPAYQDYTARAQVYEGVSITSPQKTYLTEYYANTQDFTDLSTSDLQGTTTGRYVNSVTIATASKETVVLVVTFKQTGSASSIQGKEFRVATEDGGITWECGYGIQNSLLRGDTHPQPKYLPTACR